MRLYLIVTALLFALIVIAHVARIFAEGGGPVREAPFIAASAVAFAMAAWALVLLRRLPR